ncbi:HAD-IIIA family hydrolase [Proteiniborus sp. MB09-C3]|uniref:D-glycero-alpha-D-manno-heptose-1,7-bisphosphate 7-phosphatase n=1 Tax=Proteiniborus sp. MB09-C3 TaxID=3050072 RepID=UPI0025566513|nr:HAD-IIIA family hydrolase [Proteiniborus sp. MB09-C3]WIV11524.1 HAD-IIIA family hydrolase [Proteiniborus sp. MB09-C3]
MKVAFLDRDGTIIEDYEDELWRNVTEPDFIQGSIDALKEIKRKGYEIIIITNQYLIDEQIISIEQYQNFTNKFVEKIKDNGIEILDIFYCPHSRKSDCSCMKPKDGLIKMALEKYPEIDMKDCFIVGDSLCDVELGEKLEIKTFGIGIGNREGETLFVDSLIDVVRYL